MAVPTLLLTLATLLCASAAPAREVLFASYPSESIDTRSGAGLVSPWSGAEITLQLHNFKMCLTRLVQQMTDRAEEAERERAKGGGAAGLRTSLEAKAPTTSFTIIDVVERAALPAKYIDLDSALRAHALDVPLSMETFEPESRFTCEWSSSEK